MIFKYYTSGIENNFNPGQFLIAKKLNEDGVPYKEDKGEWTSKRVGDILRNAHLYAWYLMWNRWGTKEKEIEAEDDGSYFTGKRYEMSNRTTTPKPVKVI